jgi:hypothetical protein
MAGWMLANLDDMERRDRTCIAVAGIVPDFDAFGAPFEALTRTWDNPIRWYSDYHHIFGHNLLFGVLVAVTCFIIARKRWMVAGLAFLSFHIHLVCDLAGSKGPDGSQWPIPYLWPFTDSVQLTWAGQWESNAWQNFVVTGILLVATFYLAWRRGFSPVGILSERADARFVETLRARFR